MRWERLRAKGIGPFREEIDLDLAAIDGRIVAVTGENGAGKSSMLGLLTGALWRDCPTRGTLAQLANARDAYVEVVVVNGQRLRIRQLIDNVSGKGETLITDDAGNPLTASGKLKDGDKYIAEHLPSPDVVYASIFAPQASAGFLGMSAGERKSVLLRALGIERLEGLAEKARERARETKQELATLQARIADEQARASDPAEVEALLATSREALTVLTARAIAAREALDAALASEQVAKLALRDAEAYVRRRAELVAQMNRASLDVTDLEARIARNRDVIVRGEEIRAAEQKAAALDAEIATLTAQLAEVRSSAFTAETNVATLEQRHRELEARRDDTIKPRIARLEALLRDREAVEAAAAALPGLREKLVAAETVRDNILKQIEETNAAAHTSASDRIAGLRQGLVFVGRSELLQDAVAEAAAALEVDDAAATLAANAPTALVNMRAFLNDANVAAVAARGKVTSTEAIAARASAVANADAELKAALAEEAQVIVDIERLSVEIHEARAKQDDADQTVACINDALGQMQAERAELNPQLAFVGPLAQAEARLAELEPRLEAVRKLVAETGEAIAALGDMPKVTPMPDVQGARYALESAECALRSCEAKVAVTEAQLTDAKASVLRLESMSIKRRIAEDNLADWTRLADDLGKDGIQSLEVDASGPEITEITNDLLSKSFGNRFTVSFVTTRRASDGKRDLEAFDIRILDSEKGREGEAASFSGGEKVVIGEGVSLALTTLACRRSGVERPTIVRDESGAALDPANAVRYVAMLRRAADLIGADRVLLVSHSAAIQELADARISVRDGKVSVAAA